MGIQAREILRLRARLNDILVEKTGQDHERIVRDTDRDIFMNPEQAVAYGLIDEILTTNVKEAKPVPAGR
jgi:ATP-dependent Clp protease protease subunit